MDDSLSEKFISNTRNWIIFLTILSLTSLNDTNRPASKLFLLKKSDLLFKVFEALENTCNDKHY